MLDRKYENLSGARKRLADLVRKAQKVHAEEKNLVLQSIRILVDLEWLNAAVNYRMHHDDFARFLGLTIDQYYKRKRVAHMMHFFPEVEGMLERNETTVSNLVTIAPKLTQDNKEILFEGIKGATKKAAEGLVSRVTRSGDVLDQEETFRITLTLTKSELAQLERAREVLAAQGRNPRNEQVVVKALDDLLYKRDPMQKAARAQERAEKKEAKEKAELKTTPATGSGAVDDVSKGSGEGVDPTGSGTSAPRPASTHTPTNDRRLQLPWNQLDQRPAIPAAVLVRVQQMPGGHFVAWA